MGLTTMFKKHKPLFFNGSTLYGVADGQQIGNWGTEFPVFARIENGQLYGVGIEKNASKADKDTVYKLNRAWLRNVFPNDADLFQDVTHLERDTKYGAADYIWANKSESFRQAFNRSAGPSVSPTGGGTTVTTTSSKTLKTVAIVVGVLVVVGLIAAAVYFSKKRR